jgi:hypothetical protein
MKSAKNPGNMNKVILFKDMLTIIIQYTVGLILPWWLIDFINRNLIEGYQSKFLSYSKLNRWVIGLILPWWVLILWESDKSMKITTIDTVADKHGSSGPGGGMCSNHPYGAYRGFHAIYESQEHNKYYCIYCGGSSPNLNILTAYNCTYHPNGQESHHRPLVERSISEKELEILV